jgi:hypothetical protein
MAKYRANPVVVDAAKILIVQDADSAGDRNLTLDDGRKVTASAAMLSRMTPTEGDYYVIQADGYVYLNPKDVFERKYSPVS